MVESLYGQDLDSGHHGSGFPLPPFRQRLLEAHLAATEGAKKDGEKRKFTPEETVYSEHKWNINNMPRCKVRAPSAQMTSADQISDFGCDIEY